MAGRLGYGLLGSVLARQGKAVVVRHVSLCSGKARRGGQGWLCWDKLRYGTARRLSLGKVR